jgi:quinol monooxygenase YgiN
MYVLVVTVDIKPGLKDRFIEAMLDDARGSVRKEPGCVRFDVVQDEERPDRIYLYEVYTDRAAFDAHTQTPHFLRWRDTVKEWFASPPVVGKGPNIFPDDSDWNRNWRDR